MSASTPSQNTLALVLAGRVDPSAMSLAEVDYVVRRLADVGVFQDVHNWGGISCMCVHRHGDGVVCAMVGPLFDRRYIRVYESDEDGIADLLRVAHHATLSGAVADVTFADLKFNVDLTPNVGVGGYRSVAVQAPEDVVESQDDRLDEVISDSSESSIFGWISGAKNRLVGASVGNVSGILPDMLRPDLVAARMIFGPSSDAQRKVEEVAAQWSALKRKMDADPKVEKVLRPSYDHWLKFYDKYQRRDDLSISELQDMTEDVRSVIAEVNMARANAEGVFVQDLEKPIADIASEDTSAARGPSQTFDDEVKVAEEGISKLLDDNKWKLIAAAVLATVAGAVVIKVSSPVRL